jgi:hypothetical protein
LGIDITLRIFSKPNMASVAFLENLIEIIRMRSIVYTASLVNASGRRKWPNMGRFFEGSLLRRNVILVQTTNSMELKKII